VLKRPTVKGMTRTNILTLVTQWHVYMNLIFKTGNLRTWQR